MYFINFPGMVYLLCGATSMACAVLLARGYIRSRLRLLFWSSLCFWGLTLDNVMQYVDRIVVPHVDLNTIRGIPGLVAVILLLYGLVFENDQR